MTSKQSTKSQKLPQAPLAPITGDRQTWRMYYAAHESYLRTCKEMTGLHGISDLSHICRICQLAFPSGNAMHNHLREAHKKGKETTPAPMKQTHATPPSKKKEKAARIRKLESQIQMARINEQATSLRVPLQRERKVVSELRTGQLTVQAKKGYQKQMERAAVRDVATLPPGSATLDSKLAYAPKFPDNPNRETDLDFEFLDIPGFATTDYVEVPTGTLAIESSTSPAFSCSHPGECGSERINCSLNRDETHSLVPEKKISSISFRFTDTETNAGPKHFSEIDERELIAAKFFGKQYPPLDTFADASSLNVLAPPFTPSASSAANFEPGHERRESIFTRDGDTELFDSE